MGSYSYARFISENRVQRKRRHRYRIVNRRRFICFQIILCTLVVLLVTNIKNAVENEIKGEERTTSVETTRIERTPNFLASSLPELSGTKDVQEESFERKTQKDIEKVVDTQKAQTKFSISEEERHLLERLVEAEAKGESLTGKIAVANVVLNRVKSDKFPDTITEVIMQDGQFSPVINGSINNMPSKDSILAVKKAVDEGYKVFGSDVLYFCNKKIAQNQWIAENKKVAMTIGNHTFYFK